MQRKNIEKKEERRVLVFTLSDEELALDISCVREVFIPQEIHPLPQSSDFIEGVARIRKHLIAVVDLRKKFKMKPAENKSHAPVIVCRLKTFVVGLIVDSVNEVLSLSLEDIHPSPQIISGQKESASIVGIAKVGERVIALLDLEKVFTGEEVAGLVRP